MVKYINTDLLIRKIKGQIHLENLNFAALGGGGQTFCVNTLEWVLKQINSLQQEQPEVDLEEESLKYFNKIRVKDDETPILCYFKFKVNFATIVSHFYKLRLNKKSKNNYGKNKISI